MTPGATGGGGGCGFVQAMVDQTPSYGRKRKRSIKGKVRMPKKKNVRFF